MKATLVPLNTACFILSSSPDQVRSMADEDFVFVFDAGTSPRCRHLLFWTEELMDRHQVRGLKIDAALTRIIPVQRPRLRLSELLQLTLLSWQHAAALLSSGDLKGHRESYNGPAGRITWLRTDDVRNWLKARWLGSLANNAQPTTVSSSPSVSLTCSRGVPSRRLLATR